MQLRSTEIKKVGRKVIKRETAKTDEQEGKKKKKGSQNEKKKEAIKEEKVIYRGTKEKKA